MIAFKSTLEEAINADLILNVCDISSKVAEEQVKITHDLICELGGGDIPMLTVANKCDALDDKGAVMGKDTVFISAKTGYGSEKLLTAIAEGLKPTTKRLRLLIPYSDAGVLSKIRESGKVFSEQYEENGIYADALVDITLLDAVRDYTV